MACCCSSKAVVSDVVAPVHLAVSPTVVRNHEEVELSTVEPTSIMVVVRIRPLNQKEITSKSSSVVERTAVNGLHMLEDPSLRAKSGLVEREFGFDNVLPPASKQSEVYIATGAMILPKFMQGYNACIFAYGQTGSGKTYTMEGNPDAESIGVIPRICKSLFEEIAKLKGVSWSLEATYVEIYQEGLRDLLSSDSDAFSEPVIRQSLAGDILLEGSVRKPVHTVDEIMAILSEGSTRRTRGETAMNAVSSRSHAVLTLYLSTQQAADEDGLTSTHRKLNMIDLAGSERADMAQTTGARLKEGAKINQSLSALGNVINALTTPGRIHVPYRDSKLTRLLQDSLGANAYCLMILCVSPASINYDETLSALRFAERVKKVKSAPKIARDPAAERITSLLQEVAQLKGRVQYLEDVCSSHGISTGPQALTLKTAKTEIAPQRDNKCVIM